MRKNFTLSLLVMSLAMIFVSCSKSDQQEMVLSPTSTPPATQVIDAALAPDGLFELPVSSAEMKIYKQAEHFTVSNIGNDSKSGTLKYKYIPAKGFTGIDEVTLSDTKSYHTMSGCNRTSDDHRMADNTTTTTFIRIKFTVN